MYRSILVPLDGSKRAEKILPHVKALVRCSGDEVILLQVILPDSVLIDLHHTPPTFNHEILELRTLEAQDYLEKIAAEFTAEGIRARVLIETGGIVDTIIHAAEREHAGLIAMASHGRSGLSRVFYGSVTAGVLNQIDRPLLLIRAEGSE